MDEEQFEQLRAWRWERAEGKPAYTVAADAVLEEVLRRRPGNLAAMIEIRGIGPAFCAKHGESLLEMLAKLEQQANVTAKRGPASGPQPALASVSAPT